MNDRGSAFPAPELPRPLVADLRRQNPWWRGDPAPVQPGPRRHLVGQMRRRLDPALAPIVAVRGPRQVGKTTAQLQIVEDLLAEGARPNTILRVQFDDLGSLRGLVDPILRIADWFEHHVAETHFNRLARAGRWAHLFFDEVQVVGGWHAQLKFLVDNASVRVLATGSSALHIEQGRDSLAGRISTLEAGVFSLTEIGPLHGLEPPRPFLPANGLDAVADKSFWTALREHGRQCAEFRTAAFEHFSRRGGYPIVHKHEHVDWADLAALLYETVIRRVIQHDLLNGEGRRQDPALLETVLQLVCRYAGLAPAVSELAGQAGVMLETAVDARRARRQLNLLADTLLVRLVPPLEARLRKNRGAAKLCLADHALRACWLGEQVPLAPSELARHPDLTAQAGHLAESVFGAAASAVSGLDVSHQPARGADPEVDFVLTVGVRRVPVEIKYRRRIDAHRDTIGLRSFLEKTANNAAFGVLVTQDAAGVVDDPRIVSLPLSSFLLLF